MKQIIIPYEEYLKLQKCYEIVNKQRYNDSYYTEKGPDYLEEKYILNIQDPEIFELFSKNSVDKIVITK